MAFLFKSKKHQDRGLASRDGSQGPGQGMGAAARVRDEKGARSTPTGSLHSLDNDGSMGSPEQPYGRQRGQSLDQQPQSSPQMQQPQQQQLQQLQQQQQQQQQQRPGESPVCLNSCTPHSLPFSFLPTPLICPWASLDSR